MAIVQRFFSTSSAGAADGTTWADRAALFSAGNWSTVITGFDFSGADSLQCFIGPGSYTCSQSLASGLFTNPPTAANPLLLCGCDSSGALLAVPDPDWVSAQPAWDDSTLPVIATTTNISTLTITPSFLYLLKFTASGRSGGSVLSPSGAIWCVVVNSTANTAAAGLGGVRAANCVLQCTGSSYDFICGSSGDPIINCRVEGVTGSSGNRRGIAVSPSPIRVVGTTVVNCGGEGIIYFGTSTTQGIVAERCVVANNGAQGIKAHATAAQTVFYETHNCMITGNGTAGIDGNGGAARWFVQQNRLRDNTTNITGLGNFPIDLDNYTTDSDDASEYVSAGANGDFRIKPGCAIWGKGYGVADYPLGSRASLALGI